jgi:hypothetical protein
MTVGTLLLILLAFAYFMPAVIAYSRGHQNTGMIFLVNLLRGWTVLGWFGALVWAATAVEKPLDIEKVSVEPMSDLQSWIDQLDSIAALAVMVLLSNYCANKFAPACVNIR